MKGFNGFKNWTQWNVSLWINNDEGLYRMAKNLIRYNGKAVAAALMRRELLNAGVTETPDGAKYSVTAIRAAMVGM